MSVCPWLCLYHTIPSSQSFQSLPLRDDEDSHTIRDVFFSRFEGVKIRRYRCSTHRWRNTLPNHYWVWKVYDATHPVLETYISVFFRDIDVIFASQVAANGPFRTFDDLLETSRHVWWHQTPLAGWLQALAAHPRLGDTKSLKAKFDPFTKMSLNEQSTAASSATEQELVELSDWNQRYEERFGHTFILCAAGKTSSEFLEAIKSRYNNDPANEIAIAATEQMKITELRMADAFTQGKDAERRATSILQHLTAKGSNTLHSKSPVTTHVLDTSLGKPAAGVRVELSVQSEGAVLRNLSTLAWTPVAQGQTNNDGRIFDLLPANSPLKPGVYRMTFFMQEYMGRCRLAHPSFYAAKPFFPLASVYFEISVQQVHDHFHIPLTWSPYGYSTYRGS